MNNGVLVVLEAIVVFWTVVPRHSACVVTTCSFACTDASNSKQTWFVDILVGLNDYN